MVRDVQDGTRNYKCRDGNGNDRLKHTLLQLLLYKYRYYFHYLIIIIIMILATKVVMVFNE